MIKETARPLRGTQTSVPDRRIRLISSALGPAALAAGYFETNDMTAATWWMVVGSVLGLIIGFCRFHRLQWLPLMLAVVGMIVGVLAIVFPSADILRLKTTMIETSLGLMLTGALLMGKNPLATIFGTRLSVPDKAWITLAWRFAAFCLLLAVANEIIRRTQADRVWVLFNFPGMPILHVLFVALHWPWLTRQQTHIATRAKDFS